jgi:mannosyl-oligosaccharide alpha-1,2-mannosidase
MVRLLRSAALLALAFQVDAAPSPGVASRRYSKPNYKANPERAAAIKDAFQFAWDGYYKIAYPHDTFKPATDSWEDDR